jgi:hypothetical protein
MTDPIEEARALLAKATPGPWAIGVDRDRVYCSGDTIAETYTQDRYANAAIIAAAPRLLAALADECERLRAERDARPEISPELAAAFLDDNDTPDDFKRWLEVDCDLRRALREHAGKVRP